MAAACAWGDALGPEPFLEVNRQPGAPVEILPGSMSLPEESIDDSSILLLQAM